MTLSVQKWTNKRLCRLFASADRRRISHGYTQTEVTGLTDQRPDQSETEAAIEKQLRQMEWELCKAYRDLGKMMLEIAQTEGEKANRLVDRIIEKRRYLVALRGGIQCEACGLFNEPDSRFCRHCGHRQHFSDESAERNPHE